MESSARLSAAQFSHPLQISAYSFKGLGGADKAYGGGGKNPALATWYKEAVAFYQSVVTGRHQLSQAEQTRWDSFLSQLDWASSTLGVSSPSDSGVGEDFSGTTNEAPSEDPFGGVPGANGNLVNDGPDMHLGFVGGVTRDVWTDTAHIDIPHFGAKVKVEKTLSDTVKPAEPVIKVTIEYNGKTDILLIHNFPETKVKINTPQAKNVMVFDSEGLKDAAGVTLVEVGKYAPKAETPEGKSRGDEATRMDGDTRVFDGKDFTINPQTDGVDQNSKVLASGTVRIQPNSNEEYVEFELSKDGKTVDARIYTVDASGKKIVKETLHIDAKLADSIQWLGDESRVSYLGALNDESDEIRQKIAVGTGADSDTEIGEEDSTNPKPDSVSGDTATYNSYSNLEIRPKATDKIKNYKISAPGTVTLHVPSYDYSVDIQREGTSPRVTYTVKFIKDGKPTQTFTIEGPPEKIIIDALPGKILRDVTGDKIIQVGMSETASTSVELAPGSLVTNVPSDGYSTNEAKRLAEAVERALRSQKTEDWKAVNSLIKNLDTQFGAVEEHEGLDDSDLVFYGQWNNVIRKLMTALYKTAESDMDKFNTLLRQIPADLRKKFHNDVLGHTGEMSETQNDAWDSATTGSILSASLES